MGDKNYKISLAGDLGSGKSTVGAILAEKLNLNKISIGTIQRKMAAEMGMDTGAFNVYMETHPKFDKILDDKLKEYEKLSGSYLFDSRMAWHFVPSAFSVYMKIDGKTAASRVYNAQRETEQYASVDEAFFKIAKRRESEIERYKNVYGVDITDMANYDLVVSVDGKTPDEVADEIIAAYLKKQENQNALGRENRR